MFHNAIGDFKKLVTGSPAQLPVLKISDYLLYLVSFPLSGPNTEIALRISLR